MAIQRLTPAHNFESGFITNNKNHNTMTSINFFGSKMYLRVLISLFCTLFTFSSTLLNAQDQKNFNEDQIDIDNNANYTGGILRVGVLGSGDNYSSGKDGKKWWIGLESVNSTNNNNYTPSNGSMGIKIDPYGSNPVYIPAKVGIYDASPGQELTVDGEIRATYDDAETEWLEISHTGSDAEINYDGDGNLDFEYEGSTKMQMSNAGFLGVGGNFNPGHLFHAKSTGSKDFLKLEASNGNWVGINVKNTDREWRIENNSNGQFSIRDNSAGSSRFLINTSGQIFTYGNRYFNDYDILDTRSIQLKDWDDDTGGADNKYRLLARDGSWMFYNGGVVVGNYSNGTWSDLGDGYLIVENRLGIGTTNPQEDFHIYDGDMKLEKSASTARFNIFSGGKNRFTIGQHTNGQAFMWNDQTDANMTFGVGGATRLAIQTDGQVNISGTNSELATFKTTHTSGATSGVSIMGARNSCAGCDMAYIGFRNYDSDITADTEIARIVSGRNNATTNNDGFLKFQTNTAGTLTTAMTIDEDQNVAIGIDAVPAGYKMAVYGKIKTQGVTVNSDTWADKITVISR